jgi:hypothetical protein
VNAPEVVAWSCSEAVGLLDQRREALLRVVPEQVLPAVAIGRPRQSHPDGVQQRGVLRQNDGVFRNGEHGEEQS